MNEKKSGRTPFHRVGLSFGNAGAVGYVNSDGKLEFIASSWLRSRNAGTDSVFYTLPSALTGAPEAVIRKETLTGAAFKSRFDLTIEADEDVKVYVESTWPDGKWVAIYMNRLGQSPECVTTVFDLDASWRLLAGTMRAVGNMKSELSADFIATAAGMMSGWPILYASAVLFGGQDTTTMPAEGPEIPADLATAVALENLFRTRQRKLRALSPAALEAFRATLTGEQDFAISAMLAGRRDTAALS